ncbi:MAG TPA: hypothetical protein VIL31_11330 [Cyclobacteriaceae bacterium]|jgi:hypothetical protein
MAHPNINTSTHQHLSTFLDVELLPVAPLRAGALSCLYERGNLRRITLGDAEVFTMLYSALRDENWTTFPYDILDEKIEQFEGGFRIRYVAEYSHKGKHVYTADFILEGKSDNMITMEMRGRALTSFQRNRIGLCLLHSLWSKGATVNVISDDGATTQYSFPELISPHQVMFNIRKLNYTHNGVTVECAFEGDVFETEDQRNWGDASFKTYSTPLSIPIPVQVNPGDAVYNKVTLKVTGIGALSKVKGEDQTFLFPAIGYEKHYGAPLTSDEIEQLKGIPFDHYRVELDLSGADWKNRLDEAAHEAALLGSRLGVVAFFETMEPEELDAVAHVLAGKGRLISHVLPLATGYRATPRRLQESFYSLLKGLSPDVLIGFGANTYFTEVNRERPVDDLYDFVCFPFFPQAHASDTRTIIGNLQTGPDVLATIRSFTNKPVFVSPLTLAPRGDDVDPRQHSRFASEWILLCIASLGGAARITLEKASGPRGLLPDGKPSPLFEALAKLRAIGVERMVRHADGSASFVGTKGELKIFE